MAADDPLLLLVEDSVDQVELARRALAASGVAHELAVASSGEEALAYLAGRTRARARLPRLVLLDLKLVALDGLEVLEQIRATFDTQTLPVALITSSDEPRDIDRAYRLGVNSYLRKPVSYEDYRELIAALGRYWLVHNVPPTSC